MSIRTKVGSGRADGDRPDAQRSCRRPRAIGPGPRAVRARAIGAVGAACAPGVAVPARAASSLHEGEARDRISGLRRRDWKRLGVDRDQRDHHRAQSQTFCSVQQVRYPFLCVAEAASRSQSAAKGKPCRSAAREEAAARLLERSDAGRIAVRGVQRDVVVLIGNQRAAVACPEAVDVARNRRVGQQDLGLRSVRDDAEARCIVR